MDKKKNLLLLFVGLIGLAFSLVSGTNKKSEKQYQVHAIAFYNLENLFDTINDPLINDEEFLPGSSYGWDGMKYAHKVSNMSSVLAEIATDKGLKQGAALIGLAEVENRKVVEDLCQSEALASRGYQILHFDSPDRRGIDCALLYNPRLFTLEDSLYIQSITPEKDSDDWLGFRYDGRTKEITVRERFGDLSHPTRGFLVAIGRLAGEHLAVIVCHWPSRGSESYVRERSGRQVRRLYETLLKKYPDLKVVIMGDLNDDPDNKSLSKSLAVKYKTEEMTEKTDLFDPWLYMLRTIGQGTLLYQGKWNLFDQIIVSRNLVDSATPLTSSKPKMSSLHLDKGLTFYFNEVVMPARIITQEGSYKGAPLRTFSGGVWQDGYSDHFPTCLYLVKEK